VITDGKSIGALQLAILPMTFWQTIIDLRRQGKIPKQWTLSDIRPHLKKRFSEGTILVVPVQQSISLDGKAKGNRVKNGRKPMAFRVALGRFELVDDPDGKLATFKRQGSDLN
jgi:hypothetical protein